VWKEAVITFSEALCQVLSGGERRKSRKYHSFLPTLERALNPRPTEKSTRVPTARPHCSIWHSFWPVHLLQTTIYIC